MRCCALFHYDSLKPTDSTSAYCLMVEWSNRREWPARGEDSSSSCEKRALLIVSFIRCVMLRGASYSEAMSHGLFPRNPSQGRGKDTSGWRRWESARGNCHVARFATCHVLRPLNWHMALTRFLSPLLYAFSCADAIGIVGSLLRQSTSA